MPGHGADVRARRAAGAGCAAAQAECRQAPNVSARLGVRSIPALFLFSRGEVVAQTAGAMNADAIVAGRAGNLPNNHASTEIDMTIDRGVLAFAGFMVLVERRAHLVLEPLVAAADRLRRAQHGAGRITGFCPAAMYPEGVGAKPGAAFQ